MAKRPKVMTPGDIEMVELSLLKPHPRNYNGHPDDEIEELMASIQQHGLYQNIVTARDLTILAHHGVAIACDRLGIKEVPVLRLPVQPNSPQALKILAADNEISHLAMKDDRKLTALLKEVLELDPTGLKGTGYDAMMLANLVMITRPASEIRDVDAAAHWVRMPDYQAGAPVFKATISFETAEDRERFAEVLGIELKGGELMKYSWYPSRERDDLTSLKFVTAPPSSSDVAADNSAEVQS